MSWKKVLFGLALSALVACNGDGNTNDSGTDTGTGQDVVSDNASNNDTGTGNDSSTGTDAMTGTDGSSGGTCGATVVSCICNCGMDAACQNTCIGTGACGQCVLGAQAMCCPTESQAFAQCVQQAQMASDAGAACTDQACIQQRCMTEISAFQTCVNTASMSDTTCQGHIAECLGTYPIQCQ